MSQLHSILFTAFGCALVNGRISSRDPGNDRAGIDVDGAASFPYS
jgi:hypothetical protein